MGPLLEQVGGGKESLSFMKRRIRRLAPQWASAARRLDDRLRHLVREQKRLYQRPKFPQSRNNVNLQCVTLPVGEKDSRRQQSAVLIKGGERSEQAFRRIPCGDGGGYLAAGGISRCAAF
ncbi:unnamed protein product [Boreogadus saida]